jgi:hypothetical protein
VSNTHHHVTTPFSRKSFLTRLTAFVACFGLGSKLTARPASPTLAGAPAGEDLPVKVRLETRAVSRQAIGH